MLLGVPALAQQQADQAAPPPVAQAEPVKAAIAVLHPLGSSQVKGIVRFTSEGDQLKVVADVEGLRPNSSHGFHIHEFGDCSSADGSSAGGHYNPDGHQHAGPDAAQHHAGDLGNLKTDESGKARLEVSVSGVTINGAKNPILGRSVIIHENQDDLKSQPAGNAGNRIACGVIGLAK
jgi:Cu-Zn family superoxide dismutase